MTLNQQPTYEQWRAMAAAKDARNGAERWRAREETPLYDYKVIRRRYDELREIRASEDPNRLLFYLHEGMHGNMAGMGSPRLYRRSLLGTMQLITDYINELVGALEQLEAVDDSDISIAEKVNFFRRSADCFGRTALMLSGAGALGPFHVGVIKALHEQNLLPNIISGASAGSFVTAVTCCYRDEELTRMIDASGLSEALNGAETSTNTRVTRDSLWDAITTLIPDMTFEEAYEETGRYANVSVAPAALNQRARVLNAIISPNACIREAVLASCAIPGIFPPVTLAAKTRDGERKPYVATRKWVDGSVTHDQPKRRLMRLYGVNHFISSQTNPVVLWAMQNPDADSVLSQMTSVVQAGVRDWSRLIYPFAIQAVSQIYPVNIMTRMWFGLLTQDYTADINIQPQRRWVNPAKLLANLSEAETRQLIQDGELSTWPKIEMIRNCTAVSRTIDRILKRLERELLEA